MSSFELVDQSEIASLNMSVQSFEHLGTGARHFHFDCDDSNNAFVVAFLTVPQDSTGVAHILEHTALCGSKRFPVRDPFFFMIRRSLNTFMNAFTASDWTAYPFASQNRKDFDNLLDVYLDAVFFPNLDQLDFAQEGHRVELVHGDDGDELVYKGVVFNEMKGAMSPAVSQVAQTLQTHLFPSITYHHNSGGDPAHIPELTHDDLVRFHQTHYHPSNAVFMTYGSFPVADHQEKIETLALAQFERNMSKLSVPDEQRYTSPQTFAASYATDAGDPTTDSHIVLAWLLGNSGNVLEALEARLLAGILLEHGASPLRLALETSDLGTAPSELCGFDDSTRESTFACGLEGADAAKADDVERLVFSVLEDLAKHGVDESQVDAVLHQVELSQREISGGSFPYGLQLMVRSLASTLHGLQPAPVLDIDGPLLELRERSRQAGYVQQLIKRLLLDNPHRVRLAMSPDLELSTRRGESERERLAAALAAMGSEQRTRVEHDAELLRARQEVEDDPELLPKVTLADVPKARTYARGNRTRHGQLDLSWFDAGTNGLTYQQAVLELPELEPELLDLVPLYCDLLAEVGSGGRTYIDTQSLQAAVTGGISARSSVRTHLDDIDSIRGYLVVSGKSLANNCEHLASLIHDTACAARFDETQRVRELIAQNRLFTDSQLTDSGHVLAMTAAARAFSPLGALDERWNGLTGVSDLRQLDDMLDNDQALRELLERLNALRERFANVGAELLVIGEEHDKERLRASALTHWSGRSGLDTAVNFDPGLTGDAVPDRLVWTTSTEVNFCARAYQAVAESHPDAAPLRVLAPYLRNGFLHRAIREQGGAYGAGATFSADTASFRLFSYRDPNIETTLDAFDEAIRWLLNDPQEPRLLEEALLGVIGAIDRPDSPAGEAAATFFAGLHGRDEETRKAMRARVLDVTMDDVKRVASAYLSGPGKTCVLSSERRAKELDGFDTHSL